MAVAVTLMIVGMHPDQNLFPAVLGFDGLVDAETEQAGVLRRTGQQAISGVVPLVMTDLRELFGSVV